MFLVCLLPEAAKMIAEHQHPGLFSEIRKIKTLQMTKGAIANACDASCDAEGKQLVICGYAGQKEQ